MSSEGRFGRTSILGSVAALAAVVMVLVSALLGWLDWRPRLQLRSHWLTVVSAFIGLIPFLLGVAVVLLLPSARLGRRVAATGVFAVLALRLALMEPHLADVRPPQPNLVVLEQNTYYGWADPAALARQASAAGADLVVLPEVTTRTLAGLDRTDWHSRYPYRAGAAAGDWNDAGLMVFSRYPLLTDGGPHPGVGLRLTVDVPEGRLTLIAVHFANPVDAWRAWTGDFALLEGEVHDSPAPLVVAGDFNAVPQHEQLRELLRTTGLRDAAAEVGDLWVPTFPSARSYPSPAQWAIPVMHLDHVLVGTGVTASRLATFRVDGTDHRGLIAALRVG